MYCINELPKKKVSYCDNTVLIQFVNIIIKILQIMYKARPILSYRMDYSHSIYTYRETHVGLHKVYIGLYSWSLWSESDDMWMEYMRMAFWHMSKYALLIPIYKLLKSYKLLYMSSVKKSWTGKHFRSQLKYIAKYLRCRWPKAKIT